MERTTVHLREAQVQAIKEYSAESKKQDHVPELSMSETIRHLIDLALEEHPELLELIDEETIVRLQREQFIDEQANVTNWRSGFESRVHDHFKRRFENGYSAEALTEWACNARREAEILWPEWADEDYSERRQEALEYVDSMLEAAVEAAEQSSWDPLDPETAFDEYTGVEEGVAEEAAQQVSGAIVDEAVRLIRDGDTVVPDAELEERAADAQERLAARADMTEPEAEAAVGAALERFDAVGARNAEVIADD